jgi:hypothetical protein
MNMNTENLLSNGWMLVRDAGSVVGDAGSRVGTSLVKHYPQVKDTVKDWVSAGAGLAIAKRGASVAVTVIRRHPVAAVAGAVALAGLGLAAMAAKRKREAQLRQQGDGASATRPRQVKAKNMRATTAPARRAAPAKRARTSPAT